MSLLALFITGKFPEQGFFAVLPLFVFTLNCISFHTGEPDPNPVFLKAELPIHFQVSNATQYPELPKSVERGLRKTGVFTTTIQHYSLKDYVKKEKGQAPLFLEVKIVRKQPGKLGVIWTYISWHLFFGILPAWTEDGLVLNYRLLKYNPNPGVYQAVDSQIYNVTRWYFSWLAALPFLWINLVTETSEEIIELTTRDYVVRLVEQGVLK